MQFIMMLEVSLRPPTPSGGQLLTKDEQRSEPRDQLVFILHSRKTNGDNGT